MNTFLLFPLKSYWIESFCLSVLTECIQLTLQKVTEVYHALCMVPSIRLPIYLHEQTTENYQKPRKTTQKKNNQGNHYPTLLYMEKPTERRSTLHLIWFPAPFPLHF